MPRQRADYSTVIGWAVEQRYIDPRQIIAWAVEAVALKTACIDLMRAGIDKSFAALRTLNFLSHTKCIRFSCARTHFAYVVGLMSLHPIATANTESIAKRENCSVRKVNMTMSLAFLAPDLVRAAIEGRLDVSNETRP